MHYTCNMKFLALLSFRSGDLLHPKRELYHWATVPPKYGNIPFQIWKYQPQNAKKCIIEPWPSCMRCTYTVFSWLSNSKTISKQTYTLGNENNLFISNTPKELLLTRNCTMWHVTSFLIVLIYSSVSVQKASEFL